MTTSIEATPAGVSSATADAAAKHLWMHFARQGRHPDVPVRPTPVRPPKPLRSTG